MATLIFCRRLAERDITVTASYNSRDIITISFNFSSVALAFLANISGKRKSTPLSAFQGKKLVKGNQY